MIFQEVLIDLSRSDNDFHYLQMWFHAQLSHKKSWIVSNIHTTAGDSMSFMLLWYTITYLCLKFRFVKLFNYYFSFLVLSYYYCQLLDCNKDSCIEEGNLEKKGCVKTSPNVPPFRLLSSKKGFIIFIHKCKGGLSILNFRVVGM